MQKAAALRIPGSRLLIPYNLDVHYSVYFTLVQRIKIHSLEDTLKLIGKEDDI